MTCLWFRFLFFKRSSENPSISKRRRGVIIKYEEKSEEQLKEEIGTYLSTPKEDNSIPPSGEKGIEIASEG
jgi:hypothetical protein